MKIHIYDISYVLFGQAFSSALNSERRDLALRLSTISINGVVLLGDHQYVEVVLRFAQHSNIALSLTLTNIAMLNMSAAMLLLLLPANINTMWTMTWQIKHGVFEMIC